MRIFQLGDNMYDDEETIRKLYGIFERRHDQICKAFPDSLQRVIWDKVLSDCGCTLVLFSAFPREEYLYVRSIYFGHVEIPRESAMKILVLGGLP